MRYKNVILLMFLLLVLNGAMAQVRIHQHTRKLVKYEDATLRELSGMRYWQQFLWCINDSDHDTALYQVDPSSGQLTASYRIEGAENRDWEALAQDSLYFYFGDFGNNRGIRQDLTIYRVEKTRLLYSSEKALHTAAMRIAYPVKEAVPKKINQTDFDAEALVVADDSLYLFTKRWKSGGTEIYRTTFVEGSTVIEHTGYLPVEGLITDAVYDPRIPALFLLAYHKPLRGCSVLLYILPGKPAQWNLATAQKIRLDLPLKQAEALALKGSDTLYIGCEGYQRIIRCKAGIFMLKRLKGAE